MSITTITQFAEHIGVHKATISRRLKHPDCPISATGPWDQEDVDDFREWMSEPGDGDGDRLKRAQSVKAQALAAKYLLEMTASLGKLGGDLFREFTRALEQATRTHFRKTQHHLADTFRTSGGMGGVDAEQAGEDFARWYMAGFADEVVRVFGFHHQTDETLAPVVKQMRRALGELKALGDLPRATTDEIEEQLDATTTSDAMAEAFKEDKA